MAFPVPLQELVRGVRLQGFFQEDHLNAWLFWKGFSMVGGTAMRGGTHQTLDTRQLGPAQVLLRRDCFSGSLLHSAMMRQSLP